MTLEELTQQVRPADHARKPDRGHQGAQSNNGLLMKTGETTTETWMYDRGTQAAPMVVTIVDGRIKSIERLEK